MARFTLYLAGLNGNLTTDANSEIEVSGLGSPLNGGASEANGWLALGVLGAEPVPVLADVEKRTGGVNYQPSWNDEDFDVQCYPIPHADSREKVAALTTLLKKKHKLLQQGNYDQDLHASGKCVEVVAANFSVSADYQNANTKITLTLRRKKVTA
jgi:hypothetical protein